MKVISEQTTVKVVCSFATIGSILGHFKITLGHCLHPSGYLFCPTLYYKTPIALYDRLTWMTLRQKTGQKMLETKHRGSTDLLFYYFYNKSIESQTYIVRVI